MPDEEVDPRRDPVEVELHQFLMSSWPERRALLLDWPHLLSDETILRLRAKQGRQRSQASARLVGELIDVLEECRASGVAVTFAQERFAEPSGPQADLAGVVQSFLRGNWATRRALLETRPEVVGDEMQRFIEQAKRNTDDSRVVGIIDTLSRFLMRCREVGVEQAIQEAQAE